MDELDILSHQYCDMRGACSFDSVGEFLKEDMKPGDVYFVWYRPKTDTDVEIYQFRNQPERSKREDSNISNYNFITGNADY